MSRIDEYKKKVMAYKTEGKTPTEQSSPTQKKTNGKTDKINDYKKRVMAYKAEPKIEKPAPEEDKKESKELAGQTQYWDKKSNSWVDEKPKPDPTDFWKELGIKPKSEKEKWRLGLTKKQNISGISTQISDKLDSRIQQPLGIWGDNNLRASTQLDDKTKQIISNAMKDTEEVFDDIAITNDPESKSEWGQKKGILKFMPVVAGGFVRDVTSMAVEAPRSIRHLSHEMDVLMAKGARAVFGDDSVWSDIVEMKQKQYDEFLDTRFDENSWTNRALDSIENKYDEFLTEDLGLSEEDKQSYGVSLAEGFGSAISFFLPSTIVAKIAGIAMKAGKIMKGIKEAQKLGKIAEVDKLKQKMETINKVVGHVGTATMTALEASMEANDVMDQVYEQTNDKQKALDAGRKAGVLNLLLLGVTNRLEGLFYGIKQKGLFQLLKKTANAGLWEGTQEFGQSVISNYFTGRPLFEGVKESFEMGGIVGSTMYVVSRGFFGRAGRNISISDKIKQIDNAKNKMVEAFVGDIKDAKNAVAIEQIEAHTNTTKAQVIAEEVMTTKPNATREEMTEVLKGRGMDQKTADSVVDDAMRGVQERRADETQEEVAETPENDNEITQDTEQVIDTEQIKQVVQDKVAEQQNIDTQTRELLDEGATESEILETLEVVGYTPKEAQEVLDRVKAQPAPVQIQKTQKTKAKKVQEKKKAEPKAKTTTTQIKDIPISLKNLLPTGKFVRDDIKQMHIGGGYAVATDAHSLGAIPVNKDVEEGYYEWNKTEKQFTPTGLKATYPDWQQLLHKDYSEYNVPVALVRGWLDTDWVAQNKRDNPFREMQVKTNEGTIIINGDSLKEVSKLLPRTMSGVKVRVQKVDPQNKQIELHTNDGMILLVNQRSRQTSKNKELPILDITQYSETEKKQVAKTSQQIMSPLPKDFWNDWGKMSQAEQDAYNLEFFNVIETLQDSGVDIVQDPATERYLRVSRTGDVTLANIMSKKTSKDRLNQAIDRVAKHHTDGARLPELLEKIDNAKDMQIISDLLSYMGKPKHDPNFKEELPTSTKGGNEKFQTKQTVSKRLAPNGKPSNLDAETYAMVRTPAFKRWFGDWENSPQTASQVIDANGEPLIVYHGSRTGGFTEFDKSKIGGRSHAKGIHFSDSLHVAMTYSGTRDITRLDDHFVTDQLNELGYEIRKADDHYEIYESTYEQVYGEYATEQEAITAGLEIIAEQGEVGTNYGVFLNIRQPMQTIDLRGGSWGSQVFYSEKEGLYYTRLDYGGSTYEQEGNPTDLEYVADNIDMLVEDARAMEDNGLIIKNVYDDGSSMGGQFVAGDSNQYIVFEPTQIKSATDNVGTFIPADPDIRHQTTDPLLKHGFTTTEKALETANNIPVFNALHEAGRIRLQDSIKSGEALGSYFDGMINFVANPHETTLPHETFHYVTDKVFTAQEKQEMLDIARTEMGDQNATDLQAEEYMAQRFGEWYVAQEQQSGLAKVKTKLARFFAKIKDFLLGVHRDRQSVTDIFQTVLSPKLAEQVEMFEYSGGIDTLRMAYYQNPEAFTNELFGNTALWAKKTQKVATIEGAINRLKRPVLKDFALLKLNEARQDNGFVEMAEYRRILENELIDFDIIRAYNKEGHADYGLFDIGYRNSHINPKTLILNTSFNHGKVGHFASFFDKRTTSKDLEIRKIDKGTYEVEEQIQPVDKDQYYVVGKGISKDKLEENVFGKFDTEKEAEQYIKNFTDRVVQQAGMLGHVRMFEEQDIAFVSEIQSDVFQSKNKIGKPAIEQLKRSYQEKKDNIKAVTQQRISNSLSDSRLSRENILANINNLLAYSVTDFKTLQDQKYANVSADVYSLTEIFTTQYIDSLLLDNSPTEVKKGLRTLRKEVTETSSMGGLINQYGDILLTKLDENFETKQSAILHDIDNDFQRKAFLSFKNRYNEVLINTAIREASMSGATKLRFPTPKTIAYIEGYVSEESDLYDGSEDYFNTREMIENIGIGGNVENMFSEYGIVANYMADGYDLIWSESEIHAITMDEVREHADEVRGHAFDDYTESVKYKESFDPLEYMNEIYGEEYIAYNKRGDENTIYWSEDKIHQESLGYKSTVEKESFNLDVLNTTHKNIAKKYGIDNEGNKGEIYKILEKSRSDLHEVTDEYDNTWWETDLTPNDKVAVEMFQKKDDIEQKASDIRYQKIEELQDAEPLEHKPTKVNGVADKHASSKNAVINQHNKVLENLQNNAEAMKLLLSSIPMLDINDPAVVQAEQELNDYLSAMRSLQDIRNNLDIPLIDILPEVRKRNESIKRIIQRLNIAKNEAQSIKQFNVKENITRAVATNTTAITNIVKNPKQVSAKKQSQTGRKLAEYYPDLDIETDYWVKTFPSETAQAQAIIEIHKKRDLMGFIRGDLALPPDAQTNELVLAREIAKYYRDIGKDKEATEAFNKQRSIATESAQSMAFMKEIHKTETNQDTAEKYLNKIADVKTSEMLRNAKKWKWFGIPDGESGHDIAKARFITKKHLKKQKKYKDLSKVLVYNTQDLDAFLMELKC